MEKPHHWGIERLLPALLPDLARKKQVFYNCTTDNRNYNKQVQVALLSQRARSMLRVCQ